MIAPTDPRHGTTRGYHAGCRDTCCRAAIARYEKEGRLAKLRGGRAIPATGAQRRIHALMRLGWTSVDIAHAAGWPHRNRVLRIVNGQKGKPTRWVERHTHDTIAAVYEQLCMELPEPTPYRLRTRAKAERAGWLPPLAWDDIDRDAEPAKPTVAADVDEAVVLRLLAGERVPATVAEKDEAMRRWVAAGRSRASLNRAHGWRDARYGRAS